MTPEALFRCPRQHFTMLFDAGGNNGYGNNDYLYGCMKRINSTIAIAALLLISMTVWAQDLKPAKDKATKLFGYQDKSKNWVIEPTFNAAKRFIGGFAIVEQNGRKGLIDTEGAWVLKPEYDDIDKFDKAGLCEVMRKDGKTKLRGVANTSGELVIPVECLAVNINRSESLITAQRYVEVPRIGNKPMWGVYDFEGNEIFAPAFSSSPSFRNGKGIAKSAYDGLMGIIGNDGQTLLPFENLAVSYSGGGFNVLTSEFVACYYDSRMFKNSEFAYPGYVAPYDPASDPVRLAAWGNGVIGMRLHRNTLKAINIGQDSRGRSALCSDLRLDWNYGRFVRLEPCRDQEDRPGAMLNPEDGLFYTVKAILYEADGRFVEEVSRWGWLEAECADGIIYNAEGAETWIAMKDINCSARPSFSIQLTGYRQIDHSDVLGGLGLHSYDISRMLDPGYAARRCSEIRQAENVGISSYLPRPAPDLKNIRIIDNAMRLPLFRHHFGMGEVVNCKVKASENGADLELSDRLILPFEDSFSDTGFSMKGEEEIYWGPNNARTVMLSLEPAEGGKNAPGTSDDVFGSERNFVIVIALYEEDGSYLRTLGVVPYVDYASSDALVFDRLGIALVNRPGQRSIRNIPAVPANLSALKNLTPDFRHRR